MTILLTCDAPDCTETTPAVPVRGRVAGPDAWYIQLAGDEIVVTCCGAHLVRLQRLKKGAG